MAIIVHKSDMGVTRSRRRVPECGTYVRSAALTLQLSVGFGRAEGMKLHQLTLQSANCEWGSEIGAAGTYVCAYSLKPSQYIVSSESSAKSSRYSHTYVRSSRFFPLPTIQTMYAQM